MERMINGFWCRAGFWILPLVAAAACGGGGRAADVQASVRTTTSTTSPGASAVLGAGDLERLVVEPPPPPFVQQPDDVLGTGLMEPGNPDSGAIGIGYAMEPDLVAVGFQRGWEKYFRSPDGAAVLGHVFQFKSDRGPEQMVALFLESFEDPGYERFEIDGVPGSAALSGMSPEGRAALGSVFASGRFLVGITVGGPPNAHDYRSLLEKLTRDQFARLS